MSKGYHTLTDIFKFVGAILIIAIHTQPFDNQKILSFIINIQLARLIVPLFFVFSSYYLFKKIHSTQTNRTYILKNYIYNLIKIYLIACLLYTPLTIFINRNQLTIPLLLYKFFYNGLYYHLWFFLALIYSTVLCYILINNQKKQTIPFVICSLFYIVGYLINILNIDFLSFMGNGRDGIFYGLIYVYIGNILSQKHLKNIKPSSLLLVFPYLLETWILYFLNMINPLSALFITLPIFILVLSALLLSNNDYYFHHTWFHNVSLFMYIIHPLFNWILFAKTTFNNTIVFFITTTITILISCCLAYILNKFNRKKSYSYN